MRLQQGVRPATVSRVPRWRTVAAITVILVFVWMIATIAPVYYRNYELSRFLKSLPDRVAALRASGDPPSDELLRGWVESKAATLKLPVRAENVLLAHSQDRVALRRIAVRYVVRVNLPLYTVDLHFQPQVGVR